MKAYVKNTNSLVDPTLIPPSIWSVAEQVGGHWVVMGGWELGGDRRGGDIGG